MLTDDDTAVLAKVPAEPRDEDLAVELARAAPKRWWDRGTVALGALVLVVGGFLGGLQAQKHWGTVESPGGFPAAGAQNRAGYGNFRGQAPGGAAPTATAAANGTSGTVKLVNGTTIYVQTEDGSVVTVKTDGKTAVSTAAKGKLSDVKAGQKVTVQGAEAEDGTVTATSVTAEKK